MQINEETKAFRQGFRDRLTAARKAAGMTQAELAFQAGTSDAQVSRWESGLYVPKLYWAARLALGLGIELAELVPPTKENQEDQHGKDTRELGGEG